MVSVPAFPAGSLSGPPADTVAFDVVSIRKVETARVIVTGGKTTTIWAPAKPCVYSDDRVTCQLTVEQMLEEAFQRESYEIRGPGWTKDDMYFLQATMPFGTPRETARKMLQATLQERFNLQFHQESRMIPVYGLVAGKRGLHMDLVSDPSQHKPFQIRGRSAFLAASPGSFIAAAITLDLLARNMQVIAGLDLPVINMTGHSGEYHFDLHWKATEDPDQLGRGKDPEFVTAIQQQTGLTLVKTRYPAKVLLLDHIDRSPSPN